MITLDEIPFAKIDIRNCLIRNGEPFNGLPLSDNPRQHTFGTIEMTDARGVKVAAAEGIMGEVDDRTILIHHFAVLDKSNLRQGQGTKFAHALAEAFRKLGYEKIRFGEDAAAESAHAKFFKSSLGAVQHTRFNIPYWVWNL